MILLAERTRKERLIPPPAEKGKKKRPYERKYPLSFDMARFELNDGRTLEELETARIEANGELKRNRPIQRDKEKVRKALTEQYQKDGNSLTAYWASENRFLTYQEQVQRKAARFDAEAAGFGPSNELAAHKDGFLGAPDDLIGEDRRAAAHVIGFAVFKGFYKHHAQNSLLSWIWSG